MKHAYMPFINYFRDLIDAKTYANYALERYDPYLRKIRISRNTTSHYRENFPYIVLVELYYDENEFWYEEG